MILVSMTMDGMVVGDWHFLMYTFQKLFSWDFSHNSLQNVYRMVWVFGGGWGLIS